MRVVRHVIVSRTLNQIGNQEKRDEFGITCVTGKPSMKRSGGNIQKECHKHDCPKASQEDRGKTGWSNEDETSMLPKPSGD